MICGSASACEEVSGNEAACPYLNMQAGFASGGELKHGLSELKKKFSKTI